MDIALNVKPVTKGSSEAAYAKNLYEEAFPEIERAGFEALLKSLQSGKADFFVYAEGDVPIGFALVLLPGSYAYILFYAIDSGKRNSGWGTAVLRHIRAQYPDRTLILDIEAPSAEAENSGERLRRLRFYERNGFRQTGAEMRDSSGIYNILSEDGSFDMADFLESYAILPEIFPDTEIWQDEKRAYPG